MQSIKPFIIIYTELNVCGAEKYIICYNNGTCENGTCSCTEQFTGPQCLTDLCELYITICLYFLKRCFNIQYSMSWLHYSESFTYLSSGDPPCQNNGSCLGGNYCSCTSGFSGRYCENG